MIHRTVAPFRGIAAPVLACLAAQGSLVLNRPDAAFRSRDKLLTTLDLAGAGIPVVPTAPSTNRAARTWPRSARAS